MKHQILQNNYNRKQQLVIKSHLFLLFVHENKEKHEERQERQEADGGYQS